MRLALLAIASVLFALSTPGQEISWRQITIESKYAGVEVSRDLRITIESQNGVVVSGTRKVNPQLVKKLVGSLSSPVLPAPSLSNLGMTDDWLKRNAPTPMYGAPNQIKLFQDSFTDSKSVTDLLPSAFRFVKDDDYPQIRVTVSLKGGIQWVCSSNSYYPFMLPWKVNRGGKEEITYNAEISRTIAALMPEGSLNRDRLSDEELKKWLADAVMQHVKEQWELLGVENRAPSSFLELRRSFAVERARINPYRSVDYGYVGKEKGPHEESLLATLREPSLPPNVAEDVALLFHDGNVEGVSELADRIRPYVNLALSVPWLNEYRASHPEQKMYIRFVHDRSFSEKAMQNFSADMKLLGKEPLAEEVASVQEKAALVFLDYGSDWIILPDKRMILWRHYSSASFLKWSESDFKFNRCAEYNANGGGCIGAIVSQEGILQ